MFVALDLPEAVRAAIGCWGDRALDDPALRPVRREALHVTLAFLGGRGLEDVARIAAAIEADATGPAPQLQLLDPVPRPARGRPRLFALPVLSAGVEQLQAALSTRLVAEGLYAVERRPFWPHVTVARARSRSGASGQPMRVEEPPGKLPETLSEPFHGVRVTLYRSELQPRGPVYSPLAQVELPDGRQ